MCGVVSSDDVFTAAVIPATRNVRRIFECLLAARRPIAQPCRPKSIPRRRKEVSPITRRSPSTTRAGPQIGGGVCSAAAGVPAKHRITAHTSKPANVLPKLTGQED